MTLAVVSQSGAVDKWDTLQTYSGAPKSLKII